MAAYRRGRRAADTLDQLYVGLVEHLALEGMASIPDKERPRVLGMFMLEGDPEAIRAMLAQAPLPIRVLMPRLAPRSYASYHRKVQGSLTFVG